MTLSLRGKLGLALTLIALVSVVVTALVTAGLIRRFAQRSAEQDLENLAVAAGTELRAGRLIGETQLRTVRRLLNTSGAQLTIVDVNGVVKGEGAEVFVQVDQQRLFETGVTLRGTVETSEGDVAFVAFPVRTPRGQQAVLLTRPVRVTNELGRSVVVLVVIGSLVAVGLATVASWYFARRLSQPLHRLSVAAAGIASGDLSHRVPVESTDEIGLLARSFNNMGDALTEARRRESEFLANVSHELRTPITSIRGYVEALEEGEVKDEAGRVNALRVIHSEATRLERLVEDVTALARLGAREFRLDARPVDLSQTLREAAAAHSTQAEGGSVSLDAQIQDSLLTNTDDSRVRQIVTNLLDNAIRVTPGGGTVQLRGKSEGGLIVIEISDNGPGIASEHLPHIFERSYLRRVGDNQGVPAGRSGLGLAIVRELTEALGGSIGVESNAGPGTVFKIKLPQVS